MPRYFFHVRSGSVIEDGVGVVLGDDAEAQREAHRAGQIAKVLLRGERFWIVVTDEQKQQLFELEIQGAESPASAVK